ncbi:TIR domain-containing protein [Saccharothrix saharensis]|uniref:nSTAND1 domain-containing NTPase n=1 Tax=Saccharothrix saharensis TaxID=571190 RepID=UPI0036930755
MAKVFLSYATHDETRASEVFAWLRDAGHDVFFDRDRRRGIELGEDWKQRLYRELRRTDAVVALMTPEYLASTWCTAEIAIADARGCRILPLRSPADLTHLLLDRQQYSDLDTARDRLLTALRRIDVDGRTGWRDGDNPYPGLEPFTSARTGLFFGRTSETRDLAATVRADNGHGVVAVTGPSGCGKSSLVRAGLVPALADWLCLEPWAPGDDPVSALAQALVATARRHGLRWKLDDVRRRLGDDGDRGLRHLAEALLADGDGPRRTRLLVPIDQGEELFTRATDAGGRAALGRLLRAAVAGPVRVVITLRSEFLDDLSELGEIDAGEIAPFLLGPLTRDMLRLAIEEPARIAGLRLERELVARLVDDTESGEALPLLAFALQQLAQNRSRGDTISPGDYDRLAAQSGYRDLTGLHAVLASRADHALTVAVKDSGLNRREVLIGLFRLVTLDDADRRAQRRVALDSLPGQLRAAFEVFVDHRLLTTDGRWIGLAHEALLNAWPPLDELIEEQGSALRAARAIERAAADWAAAGHADSHLWDAERLTEVTRHAVELAPDGQEFLDASRSHAEAARRRARNRRAAVTAAMAVLSVAALIAAVIAVLQNNTVKEERDAATVRSLITQADAVRESDPQLSLRLALAAHRISRGTEPVAGLTSTVTMGTYAATASGHTSAVHAVAFSPDGRVMASGDAADHSVRLWDVGDPAKPEQLGAPKTDHTNWVVAAAFSPDGTILATASNAEVILWDVTDPAKATKRHTLDAEPYSSSAHRNPQHLGVSFSADGRLLAAGNGGALTFWAVEPAGPRLLSTPIRYDDPNSDVAVSPDGQLAVSATNRAEPNGKAATGVVTLWDLRDPAHPVELGRPALPDGTWTVTSVAFGAGGATVAAALERLETGTGGPVGEAGAVRLWDVRDPARAAPLGEPLRDKAAGVRDVALSSDGRTMVTASGNSTASIWDVSTPAAPRRIGTPLTDHDDKVNAVAFTHDGTTFATAGEDREVILWHTRDNAAPTMIGNPLQDHFRGVRVAALRPGGRMMVTAPVSGPAWLWTMDDPVRAQARWKLEQGTYISAVAFSPDGRLLATGSDDRTVVLWNVSDPDHVTRYSNPLTGNTGGITSLRFGQDGRTLRSAGYDTDLVEWDVTDPERPRETGKNLVNASALLTEFSPDGRTLVAGGSLGDEPDTGLVLRDVGDLNDVRDLGRFGDRVTGAAFSPDGKVLATTGAEVVLWDLGDPAAPRQFAGVLATSDTTAGVAFSPDGRILAVGDRNNGVLLWNVEDPNRPRSIGSPLRGHEDSVQATLSFSTDGRTLLSGAYDGKAILWDVSKLRDAREHVMELACERARRELTADEWSRYVGSATPYRAAC